MTTEREAAIKANDATYDAAARAAERAAVAPMVLALQDSAVDLLNRMIAVTP